jgi:hypothetical protein
MFSIAGVSVIKFFLIIVGEFDHIEMIGLEGQWSSIDQR